VATAYGQEMYLCFCEGWGRVWCIFLSVISGTSLRVRRLSQNEETLLEISIYKTTSSEACKFSLHATLCHRGARSGTTLFPLLVCKYRLESKNVKQKSFDEA